MIFQDLYKHLTEDSAVDAIATGGVFWRNPLQAPVEDPYIVYSRAECLENDVRSQHRVQIVCFAKSMNDLEALTEAVKASLRDTTQVGDGNYYLVQPIAQTDSEDKLENGYFFNILNYYMKEVLN